MIKTTQTDEIRPEFGFTSYIWHEIHQKTWVFDQVRHAINQIVRLENYTDLSKIKRIVFAFQINPSPVDRIFDYANRFAYKKAVIFLYGKIDFQTFLDANPQDALALMCQSYLDAINSIPSLRGMKKVHFDTQKLHEDLRRIFVEKGFLN